MDTLKRLKVLKMKMVTAKDFYQVFNYFFDHFGENPAFLELGEPTQHDMLEAILTHTVKEMLKIGTLVIHGLFLIHLSSHQFIHGGGQINDHLVNLFYFEDIDVGMIALAKMPSTGETQIARFSCYRPGQPRRPSAN